MGAKTGGILDPRPAPDKRAPHARASPAPWYCATNVPEYPATVAKKHIMVKLSIPAGMAAWMASLA